MRDFDFYELTGVLVPGTILLAGVVALFPSVGGFLSAGGLSAGDFGVFAILAYATGQLLQAVGNCLEYLWWKPWGGMPTDWVTDPKQSLLAPEQASSLTERISSMLGQPTKVEGMDKGQWQAIVRQVYATIDGAGLAKRAATFNGIYGLNRGIAAALLTLVPVLFAAKGLRTWPVGLGMLLLAAVAIYRMHLFGRHYARDVFVRFLALASNSESASGAKL